MVNQTSRRPSQGKLLRAVQTTIGPHARTQLCLLYIAGLLASAFHFRGLSRAAYVLGTRVFDTENNVVVTLDGVGRLRLLLRDGYWIRLLFRDYKFEPEVEVVLANVLSRRDVFFIDCGANIGYWSLIASKFIAKQDKVVAIEASPSMFERLLDNAALNQNSFRCLLGAVWSEDNATLEIVSHDQRHAGSSVVNRSGKRRDKGYRIDEIRSITLDSVCDRYVEGGTQVVVKLDVEGAEIPALQGAEKLLLERRPLLIYEDHGNDPVSTVSQFIMNTLEMEVYYCTQQLEVVRMQNAAAVSNVKKQTTVGYNFFACSPNSVFASSLANLTVR